MIQWFVQAIKDSVYVLTAGLILHIGEGFRSESLLPLKKEQYQPSLHLFFVLAAALVGL